MDVKGIFVTELENFKGPNCFLSLNKNHIYPLGETCNLNLRRFFYKNMHHLKDTILNNVKTYVKDHVLNIPVRIDRLV